METLGDKLENRLKFHENERVKRIREIRKRNNRKKRIWIGLITTILVVLIIVRLDRNGTFDMFFEKAVNYSGNKEYVEIEREEDAVKRADLVKMAQILINHPYEFGKQELVLGIPKGPLDSAGFVDWVYFNLTGKALSAKSKDPGPLSSKLWDASTSVMESELQVGDLGFSIVPESSKINPVGIYIGVIMSIFRCHKIFIDGISRIFNSSFSPFILSPDCTPCRPCDSPKASLILPSLIS